MDTSSKTVANTAHETGRIEQHDLRKHRLFCLIVVVVVLLFILVAIPLSRTDFFLHRINDACLTNSDFAFTLKGADCEVLIYGDSSGMTGIDPLVIERITRLKTCNISQTSAVLDVTGPLPLDRYLANNKPPKYIVFQFTPDEFRAAHEWGRYYAEGLTVLMRHRLDRETAVLMAHHPSQSMDYFLYVWRTIATKTVEPRTQATVPTFIEHRGLLVAPLPPMQNCTGMARFRQPDGSMEALRARYSRSGTRVVVNVSPVPDCDPDFAKYAAALNGLTDNGLETYPRRLFVDERHFSYEGAQKLSYAVSGQISGLEFELDAGLRATRGQEQ